MSRVKIDYSLYLVTGRDLLPAGKDYYESLEESLQGGVTVVQVREKNVDTGEFVEVARRTKEITDKYNVPLLINDRVDVHLAIGSAGVHVGQTDMPVTQVRALIGPDAVLGLSCGSVAQAEAAVAAGVDYIGIGAVWHTVSKDLKGKESLGPEGVGEIVDVLEGTGVQSVAIGGIHLPNLAHLMHSSISPKHGVALNGIAIISDIVSSPTPKKAAEDLQSVLQSFFTLRKTKGESRQVFGILAGKRSPEELLSKVGEIMQVVRKQTPMINQLTNNVVINDSANATLAVGASPIMATHPRDVKDLSPAIGALLVNFGTITDKEGMLVAGREANVNRKPVVFDPVAVGATAHRREVSKLLLSHWQPTVIKGNAAEIGALAKSAEVATRGVDSVGSGFKDPANVVLQLARKRAAVVVLTGVTDYISDGETVLKVSNGHELLGVITGSGCMTGTLVACFCAGARLHHLASANSARSDAQLVQGDMLVGALAGVLAMTVAAEVAAARPDVKGPGTFRAALLDELYNLTPQVVLDRAHVEIVA